MTNSTVFNELRARIGLPKMPSMSVSAVRMRKWNAAHPGCMTERLKQWRKHNLDKVEEFHRRSQVNYVFTNGKRVRVYNKRPHPDVCELCGRPLKLGYHHWDDNNISKGLWLCYPCHMFAEIADNGLENKYLEYLGIKTGVEEEFVKMDLGE